MVPFYLIENIQAKPHAFQVHNGDDGVGGVPAKAFAIDQDTYAPATLFTVDGFAGAKNYEDVDFFTSVPNPPAGLSSQCFSCLITPGANNSQLCQANEIDNLVIAQTLKKGRVKFNRSMQINNAAGGQLQIAAADGSWLSVPGAVPGPLAELQPNSVRAYNVFDFVNGVSSTLAVGINGHLYLIPGNMQNVPAASCTWAEETLIQLQLDDNEQDGIITAKFDQVNLVWSA